MADEKSISGVRAENLGQFNAPLTMRMYVHITIHANEHQYSVPQPLETELQTVRKKRREKSNRVSVNLIFEFEMFSISGKYGYATGNVH